MGEWGSVTMKKWLKGFVVLSLMMIVVLFFVGYGYGSEPLQQAEQAYRDGRYQDAMGIYQGLLKQHPRSATLLYNIGNAYYRMDNLGEAICYYLRAFRYTPRDADLLENLGIARARILDDVHQNGVSFFDRLFFWLDYLSVNEGIFGAVFLVTVLAVFILLAVLRQRGELYKNIFVVIMVLNIVYGFMFCLKMYRSFCIDAGVITNRKVGIKSGPSGTLSTLFFVHEGTEVKILKESEQWTKVRLKNGFTGWVYEDNFWKI